MTARQLKKRNALIEAHMEQVRITARRLKARLPSHIELDDLVSAGYLGLVEASNHFDEKRRVQFVTFAQRRISGAMLDWLRGEDWATTYTRRQMREVEESEQMLAQELERQPDASEIAERANIPVAKVESLREYRGPEPLEDKIVEEQRSEQDEQAPQNAIYQRQLAAVLELAMATLSDRQRVVVRLSAGEMTQAEIGRRLNVSDGRVSQIRIGALGVMRRRMQHTGVRPGAFC